MRPTIVLGKGEAQVRVACGKTRLCQSAPVPAGGLIMSLQSAGLACARIGSCAGGDAENP
ncbi:hypothetical protein K788_0002330 [Paraburkholderia caribensis MBA4]|uniref:Uncharacterized protein n=1 Tax=Paraburkholderia caribensis MBA4 TaxID=1323664 RepID=A0A0P0R9P9_9BURK|nr:hypothetical protein K788_0002330 [Paraburkholderia caribensis MBA4]